MPPKRHPKINNDDGKVINFYEHIGNEFLDKPLPNPNKNLHGFNIAFRLCCVAPSGSGKTNWIVNLISLFCKGKGTFAQITIICKDATEPLYKYLSSLSDSISIKEGLENLPMLDKTKIDKEVATLVIIDDCQNDKNQQRVIDYYIRCRKFGVSIAYLAQNYFIIPKVVRNNCSYLVLLKCGSMRELAIILKESGFGVDKDQLVKMYEYATDTKFSPLIIDNESTDVNRRYRKGFTEYLTPSDFK